MRATGVRRSPFSPSPLSHFHFSFSFSIPFPLPFHLALIFPLSLDPFSFGHKRTLLFILHPLSSLVFHKLGFAIHMFPFRDEAALLFVRHGPRRPFRVVFRRTRRSRLFSPSVHGIARRRSPPHLDRSRRYAVIRSWLATRPRRHVSRGDPPRRFSPLLCRRHRWTALRISLRRVVSGHFGSSIHALRRRPSYVTPMISRIKRSTLVGCLGSPIIRGIFVCGLHSR